MKIATWNVNGIRARQVEAQAWIEAEQPDVVCLQEIKATQDQIPLVLGALESYWHYWHGGPKGYSGVSLHVRKETFPTCPVFSHPDFDFENRIVVAQMNALCVASVYVPNGGKDFAAKMRFLNEMDEYAENFARSGQQLALCGDFNVGRAEMDIHPTLRGAVIGQLPEERALFERMLSHGFVDVGRELDPANDALFTWWAPWRKMRERNIGWRLDYVVASEGLARTVTACRVAREFGTSDHAPVVATFAEPNA